MELRSYARVSAIVFGLVALLHAARLVYGWDVVVGGSCPGQIGGWEAPLWLSGVALLVAGSLSWSGFKHAR